MKKLLLIITMISSFGGFSQVLSQDFEGGVWPPTGWTADTQVASRPWNLCTLGFTATGQATFIITGTDSAAIGWIAQDNDANLISPSFSLVGYSDAQLDMNVVMGFEYQIDPFPNGDVFVKVSVDGGTTWDQIWVEEDYGFYADYDVLPLTLDLTPYVGQANVKMKVEYVGNDADSASVDDIVVSGTLSTNEFLVSQFSITPNPANDFVTFSNTSNLNVKTVTISDMTGKVVRILDASMLDSKINISDLSSGAYFVNINTDTNKIVKKIIKN